MREAAKSSFDEIKGGQLRRFVEYREEGHSRRLEEVQRQHAEAMYVYSYQASKGIIMVCGLYN